MRRIALSIDIDFFFRELYEWDFGHGEDNGIFSSEVIWDYRYSVFDLLKESNVEKYADCLPADLFLNMIEKGFEFKNVFIGAGYSHKNAYDFFKPFDFDTIINLDAHHDCLAGEKLHCGNWVLKLLQYNPKILYHWVYPKFLNATFGIKAPGEVFEKLPFKDLGRRAGQVVAIYIAQSPAWTPPHFDPYFFLLIEIAKMFSGRKEFFDYKFVKRSSYSKKKIMKLFKDGQKQKKVIEKFMNDERKKEVR